MYIADCINGGTKVAADPRQQVLVLGWLSERLNERSLIALAYNVWMLPFFIALGVLPPSASLWIRYTILTDIAGIPYTHSIPVGLTGRISRSVGSHIVSCAIYNMTYQVGSNIAVNIHGKEDRRYRKCCQTCAKPHNIPLS